MEWIIIYFLPLLISLIITLIIKSYSIIIGTLIIWSIVMIIIFSIYQDGYDAWMKDGCSGDHIWYEWGLCQKEHKRIMENYSAENYCKIRFDTFHKYFQVNNQRYWLRTGYAVCKDKQNNKEIIMVFPRIDLLKYFLFRREYRQNIQMENVIELVQSDIDRAREIAQEQINKAKEQMELVIGKQKEG